MSRRRILSGSEDGRPIKVVATSSPGTLVHQTANTKGYTSVLRLYAVNTHTAAVVLTVEFGGTNNPDDRIIVTVPAKSGLIEIIPGFPLGKDLPVRAFAATGNVVLMCGYVEVVEG